MHILLHGAWWRGQVAGAPQLRLQPLQLAEAFLAAAGGAPQQGRI